MSQQKILCIGGAGFIGSHLSHKLENSEQFAVAQADIWSAKLKIRFENAPFEFHNVDISSDVEMLDELVSKHDVIFNLASKASPRLYVQDPVSVAKLNLFDGYKVIDACVKHRKKLVHFSTSEVYGKALGSADPFREDDTNCVTGPIKNHRWIYSTTKQLLDRLIYAHGRNDGLNFTIVRPFNVVGPLIDHVMMDEDDGAPRVFSYFMSALMNGEPLRLVDGGKALRTFIHVDDLVNALIAILDNPDKSNGQIYNIGNPQNEIMIADLAIMMREIFSSRFKACNGVSDIVTVNGQEFYGEGFEDTERRMPDIGKISQIGWAPKIGLRELLEDTMHYTWSNRHRLTQSAMDAIN
ncbi:MAG: NAD-dependent epimerase/dehydratase family protein [Pseudomonadota bacterium]